MERFGWSVESCEHWIEFWSIYIALMRQAARSALQEKTLAAAANAKRSFHKSLKRKQVNSFGGQLWPSPPSCFVLLKNAFL